MKIVYIPAKEKKRKSIKIYGNLLYMLLPINNPEFLFYVCLISVLAATYYTIEQVEKHKAQKIIEQENMIKAYNRDKKVKEIAAELNGPAVVKNVNPKNLF